MILDALIQSRRYTYLHPFFGQAFAWCTDIKNLNAPDGRYSLRGDELIVIVESGQTIAAEHKRLESHRRYIDIQVNLIGPEMMEWAPSSELEVVDDFKIDGDIRFHRQPNYQPTRLLVRPQEFAIFWPEDAHKPCCHPFGTEMPYRKLVFKVAATAL